MSTEVAIPVPCVVFALGREAMYLRRVYPFQQRFAGAPCRAQIRGLPGQTVLMLETGLGAAAMEAALLWCLRPPRLGDVPYRPRFVLSAGFSGALQPEQRVGDLILATEIVDEYGGHWRTDDLPGMRLEADVWRGRLLTVTRLVADPVEKRRLGREHEALAVDMETATVARLCRQHDVPFACLRVISDDWSTPLSPHLVELLEGGRVSMPRLIGAILRHPRIVLEMSRLAAQTRTAARRLLSLRPFLATWSR
jgi:adenosylhomocysteine nucleosidase